MLDESISVGNAALSYAVRGLAVFPVHWIREDGRCSCGKADCGSPGKHPITTRGCLDATTDPDRVRQWWNANPSANVGMATGEPSGVWALDVEADGLADWESLLATEGEDAPYSPVSQTGGGGRHLFFQLNGQPITNRAKLGGHPIDCRGVGGYVLLPPSGHVSGSSYTWLRSLDEAEPEDAPEWLVNFVTSGGPPAGNVFVCQPGGFADAPGSTNGSRHNDLVRLVGREFAAGGQYATVLDHALRWANTCCPPHDETDVRRVVDDMARREFAKTQAAKSGQPIASPSAEPFKLTFLSAEEFAGTDFSMRFLVKRMLVAGQPCIIGGPKKSLKTSLLCDLAISLGTGRPFLGTFEVPERVNVAVLSGESGGFTLKETANRVALSKGVLLSNSATHWCFDLPTLSRPDHLLALVDAIRERECEVAIVDPAYLCLLDDGRAESAGNVFSMGNTLRRFAEVGVETGCTLILCHSTKAAGRILEPMDLEDLSQAGFAEFARQWMLLSRRERYEYGTGMHKLWMSIGGSAGHSGLYGVDVDEGVLQDDFSGRTWEVDVIPFHEVIVDKAVTEAERKRDDERRLLDTRRSTIIKALQQTPSGETRSEIRGAAGINSTNFADPFASLIDDGTVVPCKVPKANGRTYDGFKLKHTDTRTIHPDTDCLSDSTRTLGHPPIGVSESECASGTESGSEEFCPSPDEQGWEF